jgi:hypothetical protein
MADAPKNQGPMSEEEAETRSAAFAPVDTGGQPVQVGQSEDAEDAQRQREALGDVTETSGGQISSEVQLPYNGKGEVQRGVRDATQNAPSKRPIGEPE